MAITCKYASKCRRCNECRPYVCRFTTRNTRMRTIPVRTTSNPRGDQNAKNASDPIHGGATTHVCVFWHERSPAFERMLHRIYRSSSMPRRSHDLSPPTPHPTPNKARKNNLPKPNSNLLPITRDQQDIPVFFCLIV